MGKEFGIHVPVKDGKACFLFYVKLSALAALLVLSAPVKIYAQEATGSISGRVVEGLLGAGMTGATVYLKDANGNGEDEVIVDFGSGIGAYVFHNNTSWTKLHSLSPEIIATGNLDNN